MTLWFVLAMMTAAAIFVVLWPLARKPAAATQDSAINVYRDQLAEIARDRDSGRLPAEEAEAARVEVARRLLTAAERAEQPARVAIGLRRVTALAALILFPVGATILYLSLGAPWVPSEPLSARSAPRPEQRSLESLVAQVEARLAAVPDDGRGWEVLAPVYMQLGRFDDAVKARRNALRLLGVTAQREADLGEALTGAANGIVTAEAKAAFARALAIDADEASANYYVGLAAEQDGKPEEAAAIWRKLLARTPAEVPWLPLVRQSLARVEAAAAPTSGPTPDDVAAAANLTPAQRDEMVRGMVTRLAERLRTDGSDIDGWLRLVKAYMVLGDRQKAQSAVADARRALADDPAKTQRLEMAIKELGLES